MVLVIFKVALGRQQGHVCCVTQQTRCSLQVPFMFPSGAPHVPFMFPSCSFMILHVLFMFPSCSLHVPKQQKTVAKMLMDCAQSRRHTAIYIYIYSFVYIIYNICNIYTYCEHPALMYELCTAPLRLHVCIYILARMPQGPLS